MATIIVRLDPRKLANPDADIRYALPDLFVERSGGVLSDDGYDYVGDESYLMLYLETTDVARGVACVLDVITNTDVLGNDLKSAAVVAVQAATGCEVVYPVGFNEPFVTG